MKGDKLLGLVGLQGIVSIEEKPHFGRFPL